MCAECEIGPLLERSPRTCQSARFWKSLFGAYIGALVTSAYDKYLTTHDRNTLDNDGSVQLNFSFFSTLFFASAQGQWSGNF
jgi:hypothetical protein